jgi:large subunit ribosomal protein L9
MKIILLADVAKLGRKYETKEVSDGHAINFLIPRNLALAATPDALRRTAVMRTRLEGEKQLHQELLVKNIQGLDGMTLTVSGKANDKGHLFAGLHREAITAEILKQTQLQVDPTFIQLEHPLKEVGEHSVEVKSGSATAKFKLIIEKAG